MSFCSIIIVKVERQLTIIAYYNQENSLNWYEIVKTLEMAEGSFSFDISNRYRVSKETIDEGDRLFVYNRSYQSRRSILDPYLFSINAACWSRSRAKTRGNIE